MRRKEGRKERKEGSQDSKLEKEGSQGRKPRKKRRQSRKQGSKKARNENDAPLHCNALQCAYREVYLL